MNLVARSQHCRDQVVQRSYVARYLCLKAQFTTGRQNRDPMVTYRTGEDFDKGISSRINSASCLLHASRSAVMVALEAIQTLGGNGYINDFSAGRILRDAKLYEIGAGTNEIRQMLIGRELVSMG